MRVPKTTTDFVRRDLSAAWQKAGHFDGLAPRIPDGNLDLVPARMQAARVSVAYFALVFAAGFLMGAVRVPLLVPRLGVRIAELLEPGSRVGRRLRGHAGPVCCHAIHPCARRLGPATLLQ